MKPKNSLHLAGWLLILACVALLCPALSAEAQEVHALTNLRALIARITPHTEGQKVHALLIILGNDAGIRASVNKNEGSLKTLLRLVSQECTVHLTLMKSVDETTGKVVTQTLSSTGASRTQSQSAGIITTTQVVQWLRDLQPNPADTVLVYYNGHGGMDALETHILKFDPQVTGDFIARKGLRRLLEEKPARLKMLITDTCSDTIEVPQQSVNYATLEGKNRRYTKDLFLEHTGTLDITAASPRQYAWANDTIGGHFTAALIKSFSPTLADRNKDGFLEWREVFPVCISETESLFTNAKFTYAHQRLLDQAQQTTQKPVAHSLPAPRAGSTNSGRITDNDGAPMVLIPAGEFQMGSNNGHGDEKPVHTVYVDAFYMDVYEVTNAQFKAFVDANPQWQKDNIPDEYHNGDYLQHWTGNSYPSGKGDHPVVCVSWYAAMAYAEWAGKRLPTEAEWEKAARGGLQGQTYPWGNTIDASQANHHNGNLGGTTPVGNYGANGYGLFDMAGNVGEWCLDSYDDGFYARLLRRNPLSAGEMTLRELSKYHDFTHIPQEQYFEIFLREVIDNYHNVNVKDSRVLRGGSWRGNAQYLRVAYRTRAAPSLTVGYCGFRCARGTVTP